MHSHSSKAVLRRACSSPLNAHPLADASHLPFLYQTRTIHGSRQRRAPERPAFIPFDGESRIVNGSRNPRMDEADDANEDAPRRRDTTMTVGERQTFARLFESLTQKDSPIRPRRRKNERAAQKRDDRQSSDAGWLSREDAVDIDPYLDNDEAADLAAFEGLEAESKTGMASAYPPMLRTMAMRAKVKVMHAQQEERQRARAQRAEKDMGPEAEAQRQTQRAIEQALDEAKTDADLWAVLQREVFARFEELEQRLIELEGEPTGGRVKLEQAKGIPSIAPAGLAEVVQAAQKRLSRSEHYTPLARALLPTVRSYGRAGAVLGTSIGAYNEVLREVWRRDKDPVAICAVLKTVREQGLPMDEKMLLTVRHASEWGRQVRDGELGLGLRAVEGMRSRTAAWKQLDTWAEQIKQSLDARALAHSRRREEYQRMRAEGAFADDEDVDGVDVGQQPRSTSAAAA